MNYKEKQLNYALKGIMEYAIAWGLCDSESTSKLGHKKPEFLMLSVDGATLIFDLINAVSLEYTELEKEIDRLKELWNAEVNSPKI